MQLTFGGAENLGQREQTRQEVFLGQMDVVVPWRALLSLIEPHYPKFGPWRPPTVRAGDRAAHSLLAAVVCVEGSGDRRGAV